MTTKNVRAARQAYAEELRVISRIKNPSVVRAFATVPREQFVGPGPWTILPEVTLGGRYRTPDADPSWLYHNVLVSLDARKRVNNGAPSLWAYLLDRLDVTAGERILQIGAGTGYYTAILAELVGRKGHVTALEYDRRLAGLARTNLADRPNVALVHADASRYELNEAFDAVVAFAGMTHPAPSWLEHLAPGGRLMVPLTGEGRWGFMLKAVRRANGFTATALCRCAFIDAAGLRDDKEARNLKRAIAAEKKLPPLRALYAGPVPNARKGEAFYSTETFWLSRR